jgi:hypothetical protein
MSFDFVVTVTLIPNYELPFVRVTVILDLNNKSEFNNFIMFFKDFVKHNKIDTLQTTSLNSKKQKKYKCGYDHFLFSFSRFCFSYNGFIFNETEKNIG